jgi:hypothetical protein
MLGPRRWFQSKVPLFACALLAFFADLPTARVSGADETVPAAGTRAAAEGILVLRSGAVVCGKIVRSGDQYEVQSPAGTMAVPESLVKLHAPNLSEAYARLRASAEAQSGANGRITLAQWCLTNHLEKEACQELRDALALEPDRDDAKRLLRSAEDALEARGKPAKTAPAVDAVRASRQTEGTTEEPGSLGGLSREQALQFARRIQPLLVNNCTAAGCHGRDSETGFRLSKVTPGKDASRHAAERNLAEILEQIDVKKPRSSPLLTAPRGNHGRRGRPIFAGPRGEEQLAELARWVTAVAAEETQREKRGQPGGPAKNSVEQVVSRNDGGLPRGKSAAATRDPFAPVPAAGASAKQSEKSPITRDQVDPFDPANFNRTPERRTGR